MKKILLAVFLLSTLAIIIQSCTKEEEMKKGNSLDLYSSSDIDETEAKIIKFIDRMDLVREDAEYEGSEDWNYSEDSTVWYLEAALNYRFSNIYRNFEEEEKYYISNIDSAESQITCENSGLYKIISIQTVFDKLSDSLSDYYNDIQSDHKFFIVDDVIGIYESNIKMRFVFGSVESQYSIGNWYWGWALGTCSGSQQGKDAADVIEQAVNGPYPPNLSGNAYNPFNYYTSVETSIPIRPIHVPTTTNPYGNYMLFQDYQESSLNHHCLNTPEMGTFINYLPQIAANYKPSGKTTLFYQIEDNTMFGIVTGTNDDFWYMIHYTEITYGIHHTGITPPPTL